MTSTNTITATLIQERVTPVAFQEIFRLTGAPHDFVVCSHANGGFTPTESLLFACDYDEDGELDIDYSDAIVGLSGVRASSEQLLTDYAISNGSNLDILESEYDG